MESGFTLLATANETGDGGTCPTGRPDLTGAKDWAFERQKGKTLYGLLFDSAYEAQCRGTGARIRAHDLERALVWEFAVSQVGSQGQPRKRVADTRQ